MTTIILPGLHLPSLNQLLRLHWAARAKLKKQCALMWQIHAGALPKPYTTGPWPRKQTLTIIRVGGKAMDVDNLHGAVKPLVDAIKDRGWLVDDSPTWCELDVRQRPRFRGECAGYVVQIEDCEKCLTEKAKCEMVVE